MKTLILTGGTYPEKDKALPILEKIFNSKFSSGNNFSKNSCDVFENSCDLLENNTLENVCSENRIAGTKKAKDNAASEIFVIAADSGLKIASDYGLTPDLILGDLDSVAPEILEKFSHLPKSTFIRDKDYPDTELALRTAQKMNSSLTVLLGGGGGRLDHLFSIERFFEKDFAPDFWLPDENVIGKLENNEFCWNDFYSEKELEELFSIEYDEKKEIDDRLMISIFPIHSDSFTTEENKKICFSIEDEGLFWNLENVLWQKGQYSLSNRPKSKNVPVRLKAKSGRFVVVFRK